VDLFELGTGSGGGGGLDVFFTETYEDTVTADYTTGNNAGLSGGSVAGTLSDETSSPIAGASSLKFVQAAGSANDFALSQVITLDPKQKGQEVGVYTWYNYDGADGDVKMVIYDSANSVALTNSIDTFKGTAGANKPFYTSVFVPANATTLKIGFQVLVANNTKIFRMDDVELSTGGFVGNLDEEQNISYTATLQDGTGGLRFTQASISYSGPLNLSGVDNSGSSRTDWTAIRDTQINIDFSGIIISNGTILSIIKSTGTTTVMKGESVNSAQAWTAVSSNFKLLAGESFYIETNSALTTTTPFLQITARTAVPAVITPQVSDDSSVYAKGANGFGSTNDKIRRYDSATVTGTDLTYADSATLGASVTVNDKGIYQACINEQTSGTYQVIGMSVNTTQPGTAINTVSDSSVLGQEETGPDYGATCVIRYFNRGDIIRPHLNGSSYATSSDHRVSFSVTRVGHESRSSVPIQRTVYYKDKKSAGTASGACTSGSWITRTLNTSEGDTSIAALSSNQVTIGPGSYEVFSTSRGYAVNQFQSRLWNVTDSSELPGNTCRSDSADGTDCTSIITGQLVLTSAKVFELHGRCGTTNGTNGFGAANSSWSTSEVYSQLMFRKVR
jgi:hypothetical protein